MEDSTSSSLEEVREQTGGRGLTIWATLLAMVMPTRKSPQSEELELDPDGPGGWRSRLAQINRELADARLGLGSDDEDSGEDAADTGAQARPDSGETGGGTGGGGN